MNSIIKVGITGGIGTGKSLVCRILSIMGYPVFYSDDEAKKILTTNRDVVQQVKELFGSDAYSENTLNRKYISSIVFEKPEILESLNSIIHPKVREVFNNWTLKQNSAIVFNEAAILFETDSYKNYEFNILVTSPMQLRINRIMERDSITKEQIEQRISKQWPDEKKILLASFVITNDETSLITPQVIEIIKRIKR